MTGAPSYNAAADPTVPAWMKGAAPAPAADAGGASGAPSPSGGGAAPPSGAYNPADDPTVPAWMRPTAPAPSAAQPAPAPAQAIEKAAVGAAKNAVGSGEDPTYARSFGAGVVKGTEGLGDLGVSILSPYNPMDRYYKPGAAFDKPITGAIHEAAGALENLPGIKQIREWANRTHPHSVAGYAAQGAGEMVPWMAGGLSGEAIGDLGRMRSLADFEFDPLHRLKELAGLLGVGASAGAGEKIGEDVGQRDIGGPEGKEWGGLLGSLAGGLAPGAVGYGLEKAGQGLSEVAPITKAAKAQWAARNIRDFDPDWRVSRERVSHPGSMIYVGQDAIHRDEAGGILPGSKPTSIQLAQSPGLARLGEALKAAGNAAPIDEARAQQIAARSRAVRSLAPTPPAEPSTVPAFIRGQMAKEQNAAEQTLAQAREARNAAVESQPGAGALSSPYDVGEELQGTLASGAAAREAHVNAMYRALEEANPVINMRPLAGYVRDIIDESEKAGAELTPVEKKAMLRAVAIAGAPDSTWAKVDEYRKGLNSLINNSLDARGDNTPVTRRLTLLKRAVDRSLEFAADEAVGRSPALQADIAKAAEGRPVEPAEMAGQRVEHAATPAIPAADNGAAAGTAAPGNGGASLRGDEGPTAGKPSPELPGSGSDNSGGAPGLGAGVGGTPSAAGASAAGVAPENEFTPELASQYKATLKAFGEKEAIYNNPYIGPILKKSYGNLVMAPEAVVKHIVASGPKGGAMARAIKDAAADNPAILQQFRSAIGLDLRRAAINPQTGEVDANTLRKWVERHRELLDEMPTEAKSLETIAGAQKVVDDAAGAREAVVKSYQERVLSGLLNGETGETAMERVLSGGIGPAKAMLERLRVDPQALAGARQAMANVLANRVLGTVGASEEAGHEFVNINKLRQFLKQPGRVQIISEYLGPQAPVTLRRIIQDYDAYNPVAMAQLNASGSQTTPLAEQVARMRAPKTLLGRIMSGVTMPLTLIAAALGHGYLGEFTAAGTSSLIAGIRDKGVAGAQNLLAEALTNPKVFLDITRPIPAGKTAEMRLVRRIRNDIAYAYINHPMNTGRK